MKRNLIASVLALSLVFSACIHPSGYDESKYSETKTTTTETKVTEAPAPTTEPAKTIDVSGGLALIEKSDCLTCHQTDAKVVGPSYKEVAAKYSNAADTTVTRLASTIINGGKGVWGDVAMTAHKDLSPADAELMVRYILSLK